MELQKAAELALKTELERLDSSVHVPGDGGGSTKPGSLAKHITTTHEIGEEICHPLHNVRAFGVSIIEPCYKRSYIVCVRSLGNVHCNVDGLYGRACL